MSVHAFFFFCFFFGGGGGLGGVPFRAPLVYSHVLTRGGHCIGDCTPTRDRGQSEVRRSRRNFGAGQAVKLGIGGSLRTVKSLQAIDGRGYCSIVKGQGQIFGAVKGSSMKICWVKILTPVAGGSTGAYVVSPP